MEIVVQVVLMEQWSGDSGTVVPMVIVEIVEIVVQVEHNGTWW